MHGLHRGVALLLVLVLASACAGSDLGKLVDAVTSARTPTETAPGARVADVETEIRAVLQRANLAQAEAFAARSPEIMRETSTEAHYEDMVDTIRSLASAGVTAIALVGVDYGEVRVDGPVA